MRRATTLALVLATALCALSPAEAARSAYGRARQIKACNLLVPSTSRAPGWGAYAPLGQNRSPHVFFVLDRRTEVKPEDWQFVNPLAPPVLNTAQVDRWERIGQGSAATGRTFAIGAPLTKDMAPYWEVVLSAENLQRLKEMDIVYLPLAGNCSFSVSEREMLRRIADAGVLVWIDNAGGLQINNNITQPGDLFFPLAFGLGGVGTGSLTPVDAGHPLFDGEFRLTGSELARVGGDSAAPINVFPAASGPAPILIPIATVGGNNAIAARRYGSGFVVVTSGNIGRAISWLGGTGGEANVFAFSRAQLTAGQNEDLKFAYNLAAWTAESPQVQRVARHPGRTSATFNGLMERWSFGFVRNPPTAAEQEPITLNSVNYVAPLLSRDLLFGAIPRPSQNGWSVHALGLNPIDDYDRNGNPDDGPGALQGDTSRGRPYDEISRVGIPLTYMGGIALGDRLGVPYLFVAGGDDGDIPTSARGVVYAYPAPLPNQPVFGQPYRWPNAQWTGPRPRTFYAPPTFHNGVVYVGGGFPGAPGNTTGSEGIIRALTFVNDQLTELWHYPATSAPTSIGPVVAPPVVAEVEDRRTGAVDEVLFFTSNHSAAAPGGLGGIVLGTHGEPMQVVNDPRTWAPGRRTEPWDAQQWWDIRVTNDSTGQTVARYTPSGTAKVEFNVDNQPGRIRLPDGFDASLYSVTADYRLAGTPDGGSRVLTRRYWLPTFTPAGQTPAPTGAPGGAAVGPDDTVYYGTGNGYVVGAHFVGGIPVVKWKVRTPNANNFTGQSNIVDVRSNDPTFPHLGDQQFVSAPAVGDDMVYFTGRDGVLYAFETSTSFTIKVPSPGLAGDPPKLPMNSARGANLILYSNESTQPRTNRVPPDSYVVNADAGTVTLTNFRNLTIDLSTVGPLPQLGGRLGMPLQCDYIDIQGNQVQDTVFLPVNLVFTFSAASIGGPPTRFSSAPVIAGGKVYVAGENGLIYELPADPRKESSRFQQGADVGRFQQGALVRTREVSPPSLPLLAPPVVGADAVAVATVEGLFAYNSPRVHVADGNRIVEIAADSSALAATEATVKHQIAGSDAAPASEFPIPTDPALAVLPQGATVMTTKKSVNRPAAVRRLNRQKSITSVFHSSNVTEAGTIGEHSEISEASTLVADAGNNRVVEFNASGKVVWEAANFQDPFRILPAGESLKLNEPHDVQRWVDTAPDLANPGGPPLLVFHTLIADTGNRRVIELVDKVRFRQGTFTPDSYVTLPGQVDHRGDPVRWYHVLVWSSQTNAQNLKLAYRTAQRVPLTDPTGVPLRNPARGPQTIAPAELTRPPYLAIEPYQSATMVSVSNMQVLYDTNPDSPNYKSFTQRNIPLVRPGGDTILFLRSNLIDPDKAELVPIRQPDPAAPESPDRFIYVQGTVDQTLPIIRDIFDFRNGKDEIIHTLNGVSSVQRTVRHRRWFDTTAGSFKDERAIWYLVADAGGVFEFRFDPSRPAPAPGSLFDPRIRLGWAFTNDDYNWVTGGGNGDRGRLRETGGPNAGRYTGGRGLTAASAQVLPSGQVLVVSRTASSGDRLDAAAAAGAAVRLDAGDIFTLRIDNYDPRQATSGWIPDRWVQTRQGVSAGQQVSPSISWRAPSPLNPGLPPSAAINSPTGYNPLEVGGTYTPEQPTFADLVF
jgi:hypothetical protein